MSYIFKAKRGTVGSHRGIELAVYVQADSEWPILVPNTSKTGIMPMSARKLYARNRCAAAKEKVNDKNCQNKYCHKNG